MKHLRRFIKDVPDFPKPGITFRDITPLLESGAAFREVVAALSERCLINKIDRIAAIESRGFILGAAVAHALGVGLSLVRKAGKLPRETHRATYDLEYGEDVVELHRDAVLPGERVVVIDDVIATGGTAAAAVKLVAMGGAEVSEVLVLIELVALAGRAKLAPLSVYSLLTY